MEPRVNYDQQKKETGPALPSSTPTPAVSATPPLAAPPSLIPQAPPSLVSPAPPSYATAAPALPPAALPVDLGPPPTATPSLLPGATQARTVPVSVMEWFVVTAPNVAEPLGRPGRGATLDTRCFKPALPWDLPRVPNAARAT